MRFSLLGPLEVHEDNTPIPLSSPKLRALLSTLLFHANQPVPVSTLQEALWGQHPPASAVPSLQNHVARLRRILGNRNGDGDQRLSAIRSGYRLRVDEGELDVDDFDQLLRQARDARQASDCPAVTRWTTEAFALWRGTPLAETPIDVLRPQVHRLVEARLEALEWHFDAALRQGRYEGLAVQLTGLVNEYPRNEVFHIQLMRVLHHGGRRAQALDVFQQLRRTLVRDLGIEPSAAAQETQRQILAATQIGPDDLAATAETSPAAATQKPAAALSQAHLPRDIAAYTGRTNELEHLIAVCRESAISGGIAGIYSIDGMPGVGKSAFAIHAAHRLADFFPDGQIFLPLHGHTPGAQPVDYADALTTLLLEIGVPPEQIPHDHHARAGLWRARVAGKRMLLLFDDASTSHQVRQLLPGADSTLVLVTSRRRLLTLDDAVPVTLNVLRPHEAAVLFVAKAGRPDLSVEDADVREVVRLCGHLPLAVHLMAARLRHHLTWQVGDLIADLAAANHRLPALEAEEVSVTAAFDLSYRALPPDRQRLFRRLGLLPGDDVDVYAAAALGDTDLQTARLLLQDLDDHHLLEESTRGRYRMHDLIREHARALASADEPEARHAALDRLLAYYLHTATAADSLLTLHRHPGKTRLVSPPRHAPELAVADDANAWLLAERYNIQAVVEHSAANERTLFAIDLSAALHECLRIQGHWHQAGSLNRIAVETARRIKDDRRLATALLQAADVQRYTGEYASAQDFLEQALELFRGLEDISGQAETLNQLGRVRRLRGEYGAGAEDLKHALELFQWLGDADGQAATLVNWAYIHHLTGQYTDATRNLKEALYLYRGSDNRLGQADALAQLGDIQQWIGQYGAAARSLQESVDLYRALGNRRGLANALTDLGHGQQLTGHYAAATSCLVEATEICRDLGSRLGLAYALTYLADVRLATGNPGKAAVHLREALSLCRRLGSRMGEAHVLMNLGDVHRTTGRHRIAATHLERAVAIFVELDARGGEVAALNVLGRLTAVTSSPAEARAHHVRALQIAESIGAPLQQARALEGIGDAHRRENQPEQAASALRSALGIYRWLGTADDAERVEECLAHVMSEQSLVAPSPKPA